MSTESESVPEMAAAHVANSTLEDEIDELRMLNELLRRRERELKQYSQLLQKELEKRSSEAVVNAAKFRKVVSQLAGIQPTETTESQPLQQQQQQREDLIGYKSENYYRAMHVVQSAVLLS